MGSDLIADLVLAATLFGVCVVFCGLLRDQRTELKRDIRKLGTDIDDNIGRMRAELNGGVKKLRAEIREAGEGSGGRIDAVRSELVETRVAMADRVARVEGRVFGVQQPGAGTDLRLTRTPQVAGGCCVAWS